MSASRSSSRIKPRLIAAGCLLTTWALRPVTAAGAYGTLLTRDNLEGDWVGARPWLSEHGVDPRFAFTGAVQGLFSGTDNSAFQPGGRVDGFISFNSLKMGLWAGTGFHVHLEYRFGQFPFSLGGALWPENTAAVLAPGAYDQVVASSLYRSQRLGDAASVLPGEINAVDLYAKDPFFGGWGIHRFMNLAFVAPPSGVLPPVIPGGILKNIRSCRRSA